MWPAAVGIWSVLGRLGAQNHHREALLLASRNWPEATLSTDRGQQAADPRHRPRSLRSARTGRRACAARWRRTPVHGRGTLDVGLWLDRGQRPCLGRTSVAPGTSWPGVTVSRLVPSWSIWASRLAWLEAETPTTATMAPMPMAMPRADRAARRRRARRPLQELRDDQSVRGHARRRAEARDCVMPLVSHDLAVAHLDPTGKRLRDVLVVGDQHQRGSVLGQLV